MKPLVAIIPAALLLIACRDPVTPYHAPDPPDVRLQRAIDSLNIAYKYVYAEGHHPLLISIQFPDSTVPPIFYPWYP